MDLEHKFCRFDAEVTLVEGTKIEGYASLFGSCDQGGDVVTQGAYAASLKRLAGEGRAVKMLWQHDIAVTVPQMTLYRVVFIKNYALKKF